MSVMNIEEKKLVEDHLYLVRNIVLTTMFVNETIQGLGYDDLYQTGCEALCHAAQHYKIERGASFATFADTVIKNHLISHCRKIGRLPKATQYLDAPTGENMELNYLDILPNPRDHAISDFETFYLLTETEKCYSGISRKGITALKLKCMGHSGVEIAQHFGVKPNHIAAWISRAVKKMRAEYSLSCPQY